MACRAAARGRSSLQQQMQQMQQVVMMQQQQSGEVASSWDGLPSARASGGKFGEASPGMFHRGFIRRRPLYLCGRCHANHSCPSGLSSSSKGGSPPASPLMASSARREVHDAAVPVCVETNAGMARYE